MSVRASLVAVPLVVLLAGSGGLAAQCSDGPFVAVPLALSTADDPQVGFDAAELYHKDAGFQAVAPATWAPLRGVPDFRLRPVLRACAATAPFPDVDAVSTGEDWILADDATGRIVVPQDRWGGLVFSVTRATVGAAGSAIRAETAAAGGAAADVFSWILPGSTMPQPLVAVTERAHDSTEIDVGAGPVDVDALDVPLPMWELQQGIRDAMIDPPRLFFSFSTATLARVPGSWWAGTTRSGATVFQVVWSPVTGAWSCPRIWRTYSDLGLTANEDVDALSVDLRNQRILFSTKTRGRNPILFLYYGTDNPVPVPYEDAQGQPVSNQVGLVNDDDIDAICALDPSVRANPTGLHAFGFAMGTPVPRLGIVPPADTATSAFRTLEAGVDAWRTWVSGWPAGTGRGPGAALLLLSFPNGPPGLLPVTVVARVPGDPVCGNPVSAALAVPPVLDLTGAPVELHWFVADSALTSIGEAWPIRIRL